jgi:hypothetical protein
VDSVARISRVRRIVENNLVSNVHEIVLFWVCSCNVMIESSVAKFNYVNKKLINIVRLSIIISRFQPDRKCLEQYWWFN